MFEILRKNPYWKPKKICYILGLVYKKHGRYVSKLKSDFHSYYKIGSPQIPHKRVFVWENIPRELFVKCFEEKFRKIESDKHLVAALKSCGWRQPRQPQRNPFLVFRGDHGSVHWYKSGKVILYLRGGLMLARVKEVFSEAFSFLPNDMLVRYLDVPLREESRHMVFDVGAPMPRFDVRYYEKSHGIRIFTDGSHPQCLEVAETEPFWIGELRKATGEFGDVTMEFGAEIKEHLKLIRDWQKESKARRNESLYGDVKKLFWKLYNWLRK